MKAKTVPVPLLTFLLVEDEPGTLELLTTILVMKYPDCELFTATNGKSGLELFNKHMPDIVITDINMPEMSGMQMAGKIRELKPNTQFIILTGNSGKSVLNDTEKSELEFCRLIVKPVIFKDLFAAIEQFRDEIAQRTG
ncbi:MAG: response regulator [Desulfuromonadaceae bacterium]